MMAGKSNSDRLTVKSESIDGLDYWVVRIGFNRYGTFFDWDSAFRHAEKNARLFYDHYRWT